jgi:multidrug efflux pump
LQIDIDQRKAQALGVAIDDINDTLQTAWGSSYVNDFMDRGRVKKVYVQAAAPYRMLPDDINLWYVRNKDGGMVPFSAFATSRWETVWNAITVILRLRLLGKPHRGSVPVRRWILWNR